MIHLVQLRILKSHNIANSSNRIKNFGNEFVSNSSNKIQRNELELKMFSDMRAFMPDHRQGSLSSSTSDVRENFKVVIRIRPPLPRELDPIHGFASIASVSGDNKRLTLEEYLGAGENDMERVKDIEENPGLVTFHHFTFDFIYDQGSTQVQVYEKTARPAVMSILEGYNATVLAYGQTGTGKTYTMEGFKYNISDPQRGICPRASEDIFKYIESSSNANTTFMVRASYLQIYNEVISDLLKADRSSLQIREERRRGVFVEGLSEWAVRSPADICSLMQKGQQIRATASTKMNDISSRSHAVFIIIVEQMRAHEEEEGNEIKVGKLNFVDLAGSERVRVTGATGKRLEESKKINQSLSALGNVIAALTDVKPRSHIPYRDSKLTRILEDSLGGNCRTTMMAMISPCNEAFGESLSTVKFANRAKNIKNAPRINEDVDEKALLRKYEAELKRLRSELEAKNKSMMDMQRVIELGASKRLAEEEGSEFMHEKDETRKLEEKIKMMNSQMLVGGRKLEETPQFITALEEKQKVIRKEYESKLQEMERERQQIEEDKAQIDRYKQLLLRQRDIMIALTARLNERDETIIQLQEELDAYDKLHRETEENLEYKANRCSLLENMLRVNGFTVPTDEAPDFNYYKEPKRYPPYSTDTVTLDNESFVPLQMLTAEEKISELTQIIENQKGEIERLLRVPSAKHTDTGGGEHMNRLSKENHSLLSLIENDALGYIEAIYTGINENTYSVPELLEDIQKLYDLLADARNTVASKEAPPLKEPAVQLRIPQSNKPTQKYGRRPLTVDEMLMIKRQEMQRKGAN